MLARTYGLCLLICASLALAAYTPDWKSLDSRPLPPWYDEAKFGIFVHWGVYSVPAWAEVGLKKETSQQLGEWYQYNMQQVNSSVYNFHKRTYGSMTYTDFAPKFKPTVWDPARWADTFAKSGAKYVVLTSKHCDGYALWPSKQKPHWNAMDVGPERDLVGELMDAVEARGLHKGLYYCNYEWFNDVLQGPNPHDYVTETWMPMYKDFITKYKPHVVWADYGVHHPAAWWNSTDLIAWIYNESPVKDIVVIDDRWGWDVWGKHGGFLTVEYGVGTHYLTRKWEFNRGIGWSFGYNRMENATIYASSEALIELLVDTVAHNGNLLLDVGPTSDGRIDNLQAERILEIGKWLEVNGDAIYKTRPYKVQKENSSNIWYTQNTAMNSVFALTTDWPSGPTLTVPSVNASTDTVITLLGSSTPLKYSNSARGIDIVVPTLTPAIVSSMWAFQITHPM